MSRIALSVLIALLGVSSGLVSATDFDATMQPMLSTVHIAGEGGNHEYTPYASERKRKGPYAQGGNIGFAVTSAGPGSFGQNARSSASDFSDVETHGHANAYSKASTQTWDDAHRLETESKVYHESDAKIFQPEGSDHKAGDANAYGDFHGKAEQYIPEKTAFLKTIGGQFSRANSNKNGATNGAFPRYPIFYAGADGAARERVFAVEGVGEDEGKIAVLDQQNLGLEFDRFRRNFAFGTALNGQFLGDDRSPQTAADCDEVDSGCLPDDSIPNGRKLLSSEWKHWEWKHPTNYVSNGGKGSAHASSSDKGAATAFSAGASIGKYKPRSVVGPVQASADLTLTYSKADEDGAAKAGSEAGANTFEDATGKYTNAFSAGHSDAFVIPDLGGGSDASAKFSANGRDKYIKAIGTEATIGDTIQRQKKKAFGSTLASSVALGAHPESVLPAFRPSSLAMSNDELMSEVNTVQNLLNNEFSAANPLGLLQFAPANINADYTTLIG